MKINKIFILFFSVLIFLNSCQGVKDALSGKKSENSDEFLVQKKNPLVLPPNYDDLPKPKSQSEDMQEDVIEDDIEKLLGVYIEQECIETNDNKCPDINIDVKSKSTESFIRKQISK